MAVIEVEQAYEFESSRETLDGIREHTRAWKVTTDDKLDSSFVALRASGIPAAGEPHPDDPEALALEADVKRRDESPTHYLVTVKYTNEPPNPEHHDKDDPTGANEVREEWKFEEHSRIVTRDIYGNPILNKAGDWYEEPLEITEDRPVLEIMRNEAFFNPQIAYDYNRSVNLDPFRGAQPGQLRARITASPKFRNGVEYWRVKYEFRFDPDGWQPKVLEAGLHQITPDNVKVACTVSGKSPWDSDPVSYAVPLDINGTQIDPDNLPGAAVYTEWEVLRPLSYGALGL